MLDDEGDAARPQDSQHLGHEGLPLVGRYVMQDAARECRIEAAVGDG